MDMAALTASCYVSTISFIQPATAPLMLHFWISWELPNQVLHRPSVLNYRKHDKFRSSLGQKAPLC